MTIHAIVEQPAEADEKRGAARWRIRLEVPGSFDHESGRVIIHDISTDGMLVETQSQLEVGQAIAVSLPETEGATAQVVWQNEPLFGCRFDQPISQAALSAAKLLNPISIGPRPAAVEGDGREMLPERLRRLRRERGLSRAALSERTGFSKPSIWAWESGRTMPRHSNLLTLADAFGLTAQELIMGEQSAHAQATAVVPHETAGRLSEMVDEARENIARHAGVSKDKVHVYIAF
jgi:transcriptional regulator with XRE-family HTH domain